MIIWQIFSLVIWLLAVPFCIGLLPVGWMKKELHSLGTIWVAGYIVLFFLLELVGIPIVLMVNYHGFTIFSRWFAAALLIFAVIDIWMTVRKKEEMQSLFTDCGKNWKSYGVEEKIVWVLFLLLVGFQLYMAFTRASFDGDDAYYGVQALIAQQIDVLYRIDPNNGWSTVLDARHALALFPIWEAFIGKMSGIHATIICHSVIPMILIPLTYTLYYQIGKVLFAKKKELLPMFMVVIALWQMFGNVSIYTTETFFLTRTWQGKSFAGNFVIPAVLWIFVSLFVTESGQEDCEKTKEAGRSQMGLWLLLSCLNLAGGASSSLAVLLSLLLTVGLGTLFAIKEKRIGILIRAGLTCFWGGVYVVLYLILRLMYAVA